MHVQEYPFVLSVHVPPFWQGDDRQSLTSTAQLYPAQPVEHTQLYMYTESKHVPLCKQGLEPHSSTFVEQVPVGVSV